MSDGNTIVKWTTVAGVEWEVRVDYARDRQQFEATIRSRVRDQWFERERMIVSGRDVFDQ